MAHLMPHSARTGVSWIGAGGPVESKRLGLRLDRSPVCVHPDFPPVVHDWVIKGLGMFSHVGSTGHIQDPLLLGHGVPVIGFLFTN